MAESPSHVGPQLSGQFFAARLEYLRKNHGPSVLSQVLEALAPEDRERLKGLERDGWYPFGMVVRFDHVVARLVGSADPEILDNLGAASSRIRHEWLGEHASLVSPHAFLSRAADEHRRFHSFGCATYTRTGFNEGEIAFSDYPETDPSWCLGARGYLRATLELLTSGSVSVEERSCQCRGDAACLFWLRWNSQGLAEPGSTPP